MTNKMWDDMMSIGIVHFMAFPETIKGEGPVLETIEKIVKDDFFKAIEITRVKDKNIRLKVKSLLDASGIAVAFAAQPPLLLNKLSLNDFDKKKRDEAINVVKSCIDEALSLGAGSLAVLSGPDLGIKQREPSKAILVDSLKEICAYAKGQGNLPISLETFDRDIDKKRLIGPTHEAVLIAEKVKEIYPDFGLMLDLSHLPLLGENIYQALNVAKGCLVHVHMGNCVITDRDHAAYGDNHPIFGIKAGENGVNEVKEFLEGLFKINFFNKPVKPIVSFEVKPHGEESSESVIKNAKDTFAKAWELLDSVK